MIQTSQKNLIQTYIQLETHKSRMQLELLSLEIILNIIVSRKPSIIKQKE